MTITVFAELQEVLNLEEKDGEPAEAFAERLALKANTLKDDEWETLSESTQRWVNDALTALEEKKDIPLPEGMVSEESTEEETPTQEAGDAGSDPETSPKETKAKKKKAPAKAKAAPGAKPAKAAKAPTKATKPAKKAKAKPEANGGGRPGPKGTFSRTAKIKIVAKENPYREGTKSAKWFAVYKEGMTVEAAIAAGTPRHHIRWDAVQGNIKLS